jgi:Small metal-binding protein
MTCRKQRAVAVALAVSLFIAPALSATENHVAEAVEHIKEAINLGQQGQSTSFADHAQLALDHAKAAEQEKPNTHTESAIAKLTGAVDYIKAGHEDAALTSAESALTYLAQVK